MQKFKACRKRASSTHFFLVDHDAMHESDLRCWSAEIDAADLQPDFEGFAETWTLRHAVFAGQLWRSSAAKRSQANNAS